MIRQNYKRFICFICWARVKLLGDVSFSSDQIITSPKVQGIIFSKSCTLTKFWSHLIFFSLAPKKRVYIIFSLETDRCLYKNRSPKTLFLLCQENHFAVVWVFYRYHLCHKSNSRNTFLRLLPPKTCNTIVMVAC